MKNASNNEVSIIIVPKMFLDSTHFWVTAAENGPKIV